MSIGAILLLLPFLMLLGSILHSSHGGSWGCGPIGCGQDDY